MLPTSFRSIRRAAWTGSPRACGTSRSTRFAFVSWVRRPSRVLDFIGINYYVRQVVRWSPRGTALLFGSEHKDTHSDGGRQFSSLGWEVYPQGLQEILRRFAAYRLPLIVTENGIATSDEALRASFIEAHVRALARSMNDGANVLGYFYWTLFDNDEWTEGRNAHFGLAAVDPLNQRRIERPAARVFEKICRSNEIQPATPQKTAHHV